MIAFTLLKQYWRVGLAIAIAAILALHLWSDNRVKAQRDDYKAQLTAIESLAEYQKKDYEAKLKFAKDSQAKTELVFKTQIDNLHLNRTKLTNELRSIYANRKPKPYLVPNAGGVLPQSTSTESTTNTASDTSGSAEGERISGSTCAGLQAENSTLEDALVLETIEFNRCRVILDNHCLQIGCEITD